MCTWKVPGKSYRGDGETGTGRRGTGDGETGTGIWEPEEGDRGDRNREMGTRRRGTGDGELEMEAGMVPKKYTPEIRSFRGA